MKYNYKNFLKLKDKKVIILGGSGLIGSEISQAFCQVNSKILILDMHKPKKDLLLKKNIFFEKFNIAESENIDQSLKKITKNYFCPDIFINASWPKTLDWAEMTFDKSNFNSVRKNIDIHLNSFIWISNYFAKEMKRKKIIGSIINFSSIYGVIAQDPNLYINSNINLNMIYGTIKSAISHFTRQLAAYYAANNIRSNAIAPGGLYGHIAGSKKKQDANFIKKYKKTTPLNRLCYAYEVANLTLFLSSEASSYITGQTLLIDGGKSSI